MAQVNTDLETLKTVRDDMKLALEGQGQIVSKDIRTYAEAISNISGGDSSNIKLYSSVAEMREDVTEPDNEYGVVYYENKYPITENMISSSIIINSEITLDSVFSGNDIDITVRDDNYLCDISLRVGATNASVFIYKSDGYSNISYSSSDGIHYTMTSADEPSWLDTPLSLGTEMKFINEYGDWNNVFGKFFNGGGMYFEGMYEWKDEVDEDYYASIVDWEINGTTASTINEEVYLPKLTTILKDLQQDIGQLEGFVIKVNDEYFFQDVERNAGGLFYNIDNNKVYYGNYYDFVKVGAPKYKLFKLDLDNQVITQLADQDFDLKLSTASSASAGDQWTCLPYNNGQVIHISSKIDFMSKCNNSGIITTNYYDVSNAIIGHISFKDWHRVQTEFNLEHTYQIAENVTALGKHGPITGDGSILNKIDWVDFLSKYRSNVDVLMSQKGQDGKHAEKLQTPTQQSIMEGNYDVRVLHNIPFSDNYMYNDMVALSKSYIMIRDEDTYPLAHLYDYYGNLVVDLDATSVMTNPNNSIPLKYLLEIDDDTIGLAYYWYNSGTYFDTYKISTGTWTHLASYTSEKTNISTTPCFTTYDSTLGMIAIVYIPAYNANGQLCFYTKDTKVISSMPQNYIYYNVVTPEIYSDSNYYYCFVRNNVSPAHIGYMLIDKATGNYVTTVTPQLGNGSVVLSDDGKIYATFGAGLYEINGTTYTKLYDLYQTIPTSNPKCVAGYLVNDDNNNPYLIANSYIQDLTNGTHIPSLQYSYEHMAEYQGKVIMQYHNEKMYICTHRPNIFIDNTGENIILECEKNTLLDGYSEYAVIENNSYNHL